MIEYIFFTSSRSEFSILRNLITLFKKNNKNFKIIVTGSHLFKKFGETNNEIEKEFKDYTHYLKISENKNNNKYFQQIIKNCEMTIKKFKPKKLIILGDRIETFGACISFFLNNICIFHLHGGEVTNGSLDDAFRHSITKMSNIHFVTNNIYKKRVMQLGENPKNIYNYGSLAIENILKNPFIKKNLIEKKFNFKFSNKNIIVNYHPNTKINNTFDELKIIFYVVQNFKNIQFIFTSSNNDIGGIKVNREIVNFCKKNNNTLFIHSFGYKYYYSVLNECNIMIGNSSSGIIEAPVLGLPVINLGNRQDGRFFDKKIVSIEFNKSKIINQINKILFKTKYKNKKFDRTNINFNKNTHRSIYKIINSFKINKNVIKKFYDN